MKSFTCEAKRYMGSIEKHHEKPELILANALAPHELPCLNQKFPHHTLGEQPLRSLWKPCIGGVLVQHLKQRRHRCIVIVRAHRYRHGECQR